MAPTPEKASCLHQIGRPRQIWCSVFLGYMGIAGGAHLVAARGRDLLQLKWVASYLNVGGKEAAKELAGHGESGRQMTSCLMTCTRINYLFMHFQHRWPLCGQSI